MAGGRAFRPSAPRRAAFAALLTLLLLASLSFFLSSAPASSRPRLSSVSPPPSRLAAIRRHAADHAAVLAAYAAHARRLKEASAAQSLSFSAMSSDLSALSSRLASHLSLPEDAVKPLEKEARDRIKLARLLAADAKEGFDTQSKIQKLSDTVFAVGEQLARARRAGRMSSRIAAGSTPKSLHCLAMRLLEARLAKPSAFADDPDPSPEFDDPSLYHYAVFSDNVLAVSVVVASAARAAADPSRHVFHVVTAPMYLPAFRVWFARRPPPLGVHVQLLAYSDFTFLNETFSPVLRQIEAGKRDVTLLDYLRFYLPHMFPALQRVVLLEDDVVVQKDLAGLWHIDLDGRVNGAVEMCFGGFRRYSKYLNFTQDIVQERFKPDACAWAYGVNVYDLEAWRRDGCTELFHQYMEVNEDGALWDPTSVLPAGLMTFYGNTKPLDKSWHVMGLGYNPSISPEVITGAAVIHFNGNMKPWLDVALNQYKALWTKYVDTEMEFLTLCNFGL
ncbi:probable galacturonosyltransferase 9 [Oryza brachyantha]|nr:probable galacturonosyltransferase 9 [Oryza brachyantha]